MTTEQEDEVEHVDPRVVRSEEVGRTVRFLFGIIALVIFVLAVLFGAYESGRQETERVRICIEAGGSWNAGQGDCNVGK